MLSKLPLSPGLLIDHSQAHLQISIEKGGLRGGGEESPVLFFLLADMVTPRSVEPALF